MDSARTRGFDAKRSMDGRRRCWPRSFRSPGGRRHRRIIAERMLAFAATIAPWSIQHATFRDLRGRGRDGRPQSRMATMSIRLLSSLGCHRHRGRASGGTRCSVESTSANLNQACVDKLAMKEGPQVHGGEPCLIPQGAVGFLISSRSLTLSTSAWLGPAPRGMGVRRAPPHRKACAHHGTRAVALLQKVCCAIESSRGTRCVCSSCLVAPPCPGISMLCLPKSASVAGGSSSSSLRRPPPMSSADLERAGIAVCFATVACLAMVVGWGWNFPPRTGRSSWNWSGWQAQPELCGEQYARRF